MQNAVAAGPFLNIERAIEQADAIKGPNPTMFAGNIRYTVRSDKQVEEAIRNGARVTGWPGRA